MEKEIIYTYKVLSSLAKVFSDEEPIEEVGCSELSALRGETVSFQVAYAFDFNRSTLARVRVESPYKNKVRVREIIEVPCHYPTHLKRDDKYLRTKPGLFPDLLRDLDDGRIMMVPGQWRSLWVDIEIDESIACGDIPIELHFSDFVTGKDLGKAVQNVTVYDVTLPKQKMIRTEWFHVDCLADYYGLEMYSKEHWVVIKKFIETAVNCGCNMILTPQFTPPLDTAKGYERTTTQLVEISVTNGTYSFDFSQLKYFIDLCHDAGMEYFELSHLFSQWGAIYAPKVMATVDGEYKQLFGWNTDAVGGEYTKFLHIYLPQLIAKIEEWGIKDKVYFHISDEPIKSQLESYTAAKNSVSELIKDFPVIDALSDYEFYKTGAIEKPISSNDKIHDFIDNGVQNLWSYYCTAQCVDVSNRFFALPSFRNRIYGFQLFKYDIEGILHWGYNFYNGQDSFFRIDPYTETCTGSTYPGGDPFLVYPGKDKRPEESIRLMIQLHVMNDVRAFQHLADKVGKDSVMKIIEEGLQDELTFSNFPQSALYIIKVRNKVNKMLSEG